MTCQSQATAAQEDDHAARAARRRYRSQNSVECHATTTWEQTAYVLGLALPGRQSQSPSEVGRETRDKEDPPSPGIRARKAVSAPQKMQGF